MATQRECQDEWKILCAKTAEKIDLIDKETPHEGGINADAPRWWLEMADIRRAMREISWGDRVSVTPVRE